MDGGVNNMNIKKAAKRIVALASGTGMVAATLMGALAYDLADYPSEFIEGGQFDGKIVLGASAAVEDVIGATDIIAALQAASTTEVPVEGSTTTVVVEGDAVKIGESADLLEIGEYIGDVRESLDEDDLEMLMSGRVTTSKGSTEYTQTMDLDVSTAGDTGLVKLDRNKEDETEMFLYFEGGETIFSFDLEFTSGLESDLDTLVAEDLEDESFMFLGQEYSIVAATCDAVAPCDLVIELIAGDVVATLEEGQSKTYTVQDEDGNEKDYEVTLLLVSTTTPVKAKFLINGEVTDALEDAETDTLQDGTEIGVREILASDRDFEGDSGSLVEFYLGANKITFDTGNNNVEVNRESMNNAWVDINYTDTATATAGDITVRSITYNVTADATSGSNIFIAEGESLRDYQDEPESLLNEIWDISFQGLSEPD